MTHLTADPTGPHPDHLSLSPPPPRSSRGLVVLVTGVLALVALALLAGVLTSGMLTLGSPTATAPDRASSVTGITGVTATMGGAGG